MSSLFYRSNYTKKVAIYLTATTYKAGNIYWANIEKN